MPPNKNWARWTFASVSKHFDDHRQGLELFIEGQHRNTKDLENYLELRMDGPTLREVSKGCWKLRIEINVLITSAFREDEYHRPHQNAGIAQAAFTKIISAFRFGNGPDDDDSFLGCYQLQQSNTTRDFIELNHFGRIDINTPLVQATVEGHYIMTLNL